MKTYRTSESVCSGHPDKLCDFIADSILDECLRKDKFSRVACEVMAAGLNIVVGGEITCSGDINVNNIVSNSLEKIGYNPNEFKIYSFIQEQSKDIADGVDRSIELRSGDSSEHSNLGAGDQGTVYGYATNETKEQLPLSLILSHKICKTLDTMRKDNTIIGIKPDGKAQVTIEYEDDKPVRVKTIVVSIQHDEDKNINVLRNEIVSKVLKTVFEEFRFDEDTEILINPSGRFIEGGPKADTGLTGRKLMVDTYGGQARHGGGAFSGKDSTKVDRSGAYMARYVAKNIVSSGIARECLVSISYAIGKAEPVAVQIDTFGTSSIKSEIISKAVSQVFDMRPSAIIDTFGLRECCFSDFSAYGHFGNKNPKWENIDKCEELKETINQLL